MRLLRRGRELCCKMRNTLWSGGWDEVEGGGEDKNIEDYREGLSGSRYEGILQTIIYQPKQEEGKTEFAERHST